MRSSEEIKKDVKLSRGESSVDALNIEVLLDIREQLGHLNFELERIHKELETIRLRG